jgi:hypothetical protein
VDLHGLRIFARSSSRVEPWGDVPSRENIGGKALACSTLDAVNAPRACGAALTAVAIVALAACGARTALLDTKEGALDGGVPDAPCNEPPWLLFDVLTQTNDPPGAIYAMRADGSALHAVSLPHGPALYPSVSPDGSKLLYGTFMEPVDDGGVDSALYLYDFATGTAKLVVTTTQLSYSALSPDGQTVAYTTGYDLHDISPDGTNDRTLLAGPSNGTGFGHPAFTADSRTILYGTGGVIGLIGVDGTDNETLVNADPGALYYPNAAFSPDYSQLVLGGFCDQTSPDALLILPYASLPQATCQSGRVLTDVNEASGYSMANDPSWGSNDVIAYGSGPDVYFIGAGGGQPTDMTSGLTGDSGVTTASDPVWAPGCAAVP